MRCFPPAFALLIAVTTANWARTETIRFDRDIRPILSDKCFFCHGPDEEHREGGLRLDLAEEAGSVIAPGEPESSELIARILSHEDDKMPPADANKELSKREIELLTQWVQQGAGWTQHWSFVAPSKSPTTATLPRDVIDELIRQQIPDGKLSEPATRETLIRRLSFDLTGMPPTIEEIDTFLADQSPDAYERLVDRMLQSPRYGQRMALAWLDAARYGDTSVYHADGPRDMWAWRDAIVDAYNQNMPYDQFSIFQLAGDLIPEGTIQQKILAGFNRNNGTTDEGGAIAEEYRVEYAVDRVKTTSTVWLGLTMECGQCHDHKYDPISKEDYYRFYAFFNISRDAGMQTRNGNAEPLLEIPDPEKQSRLPDVQRELSLAQQRITELETQCEDDLQAWIAAKRDDPKTLDLIPEGCVLRVPLIEGSGTEVAATVPSDLKGQLQGNAQWTSSRVDWSLKLDGNTFVDLGDVANFERTDAFSYGGWIKPQRGAGQGALLARMDDANAYRGFDVLAGAGPVSVHLIHRWPDNAVKVTTNKQLSANQWHHVMVTYDGSSKAAGIQIFVDGEKWDWKIEQDGLSDTIRTEKSLLIGSRHPGSRFKGEVDEVQIYSRKLEQQEIEQLAQSMPIGDLLAMEADKRSDAQQLALKRFFLRNEQPQYVEFEQQVQTLSEQLEELKKPLTTVMIMSDMESPRETFILNRGAYDAPTDRRVEPGTPAILPPMSHDASRNRLGLARWLFREDHPLTARVAVNRYWQMMLGEGLVSTPEDFGSQGEFPSHPELLDWLAVDFRESGWDTKRLIKEIVMSQTYRQTSRSRVEAYRADPRNRLLSRGSRFRLQGEFIRDAALSVSGLLVDEFGGPGVKPYQPPGLWAEVGLGGNPKFVQDHGDKLYRRSLYTYWKRSAPPPAMQIFDAPTREKCTVRRARTNTPLQALVTLNDTQFVEAARHFAERMIHEGGKSDEERLTFGFRLVSARRPKAEELKILQEVLEQGRVTYRSNPQAATELLSVGESKRDDALSVDQHAAWTVVASTLLNLDETLTRE